MTIYNTGIAVCMCVSAAWGTPFGQDAWFRPLGTIPGGEYSSSVAHDVSDDGRVVVGRAGGGGITQAFRWTPETGMVGLGDLPGSTFHSDAYAVSGDGLTVVGRSISYYSGPDGKEAFRWTAETGMEGLGDFWGGDFDSEAEDVSADGSVVVGKGTVPDIGPPKTEGFRWTEDTWLVGLGQLYSEGVSHAKGCSADGSVIVGQASTAGQYTEAFLWTSETGIFGLGDLPGGPPGSVAWAVSADGSSVVGYSYTGTWGKPLQEVYRWTEETGMVGLGFYAWAWDVSADGSVIVGDKSGWVYVWDEQHGARELEEVLLGGGVDLTGWDLWTAEGVSADGQTIVGAAYNPAGKLEAYVAHIPEPVTLALLIGSLACAVRRGLRPPLSPS